VAAIRIAYGRPGGENFQTESAAYLSSANDRDFEAGRFRDHCLSFVDDRVDPPTAEGGRFGELLKDLFMGRLGEQQRATERRSGSAYTGKIGPGRIEGRFDEPALMEVDVRVNCQSQACAA
jgi:hypothetical protein